MGIRLRMCESECLSRRMRISCTGTTTTAPTTTTTTTTTVYYNSLLQQHVCGNRHMKTS